MTKMVRGINNKCQGFSLFKEYNLFTIGDVVQSDVDWQGRGAIGGNATLTNFGIGKNILPLPKFGGDATLVVRGNLTWNSGTNFAGNTVMLTKTKYNVTKVSYNNSKLQYQPKRVNILPIDFEAAYEYANCLSKNLSTENSIGDTLILNCFGNIFLIGNSSDINIFNFNTDNIAVNPNIVGEGGNSLKNIYSLTILTPNDSTNILNVSGESIEFGNYSILRNTSVPAILPSSDTTGCNKLKQGSEPSEEQIRKILWNFYEATSITMSNISLQGSLLAPNAELKAVSGNIQGNVVVQSFTPNDGNLANHTELHDFPFDGCIPSINCIEPNNTIPSSPNKKPIPKPIPTRPGRPNKYHKPYDQGGCINIKCLCCVRGVIWYDCNKNRCMESNEKGMANVIVDLYDYQGVCISRTLTDSFGQYSFIELDPGEYWIVFSNINNEINRCVDSGYFILCPERKCMNISLGM